jgi:hypothetical protein
MLPLADRSFLCALYDQHLPKQKTAMQKQLLFILLGCVFISANAQKIDWKKLEQLTPDRVLLAGERQPTKVLLLGTFHFGYPNLDGHKTDSAKFINVLSPTRQKELEELAEVIMRFKPTRVYI